MMKQKIGSNEKRYKAASKETIRRRGTGHKKADSKVLLRLRNVKHSAKEKDFRMIEERLYRR